MRFLLDEDVPVKVARCLRGAGHPVTLVVEILGAETDDETAWQHAVHSGEIVVTCNRQGFLQLAGSAPETGLIILNRRRTRQAECGHILRLVREAGEMGLKKQPQLCVMFGTAPL